MDEVGQGQMEDPEHLLERTRGDIKRVASQVRQASQTLPPIETKCDHDMYGDLDSEKNRNLELAYRHLEDARMRLGKAMQAYQGGVSVFDRPGAKDMARAAANNQSGP